MAEEKKYNAADEKLVAEREKKNKNDRDQELEDVKFIINTPQGIRFFKRMMVKGHMFQTTFTGNSQAFFLEGHRNFMLEYFGDVCEACPEKIAELLRVQKNV
jgi:hypothetical protein